MFGSRWLCYSTSFCYMCVIGENLYLGSQNTDSLLGSGQVGQNWWPEQSGGRFSVTFLFVNISACVQEFNSCV